MNDPERDIEEQASRVRGGQGGGHLDEVGQAERTGTGRQPASQRHTEFTQDASRRADEGTGRGSSTIDDASRGMREGASQMHSMASERMWEGMDRAEQDGQRFMDGVERFVREHPIPSVVGALIGGFMIARLLRLRHRHRNAGERWRARAVPLRRSVARAVSP